MTEHRFYTGTYQTYSRARPAGLTPVRITVGTPRIPGAEAMAAVAAVILDISENKKADTTEHQRCSIASAYSLTGPPANWPSYPLFSHPRISLF